ncbi:MAG: hypothetical protein IJ493_10430 [Clostridia bacterium]|nr:hypothetical protein [Clostridia bacterium]
MNNNQDHNTFHYIYSAKEQEELKRIRQKYLPREEDKMERLRRLDAGVTQKGTIAALIIGILGALTMGFGMSCVMVWTEEWFFHGILIGSVGIVLTAVAYPLYRWIIRREREKIAPEVIRLTDELMK